MRNFEERMAEIQKRSRARIARRRNQLTALCVPVIAALCVSGALLIPQQSTYPHTADTEPTVTTQTQYFGSVTVVNGKNTVTHSSRDTVEAVRHLVSSLPPVQETAVDAIQKYTNEFNIQATSLSTNYTLILETEEGTVQYKLLGKVLTNRDTGEHYALTDIQRAELLKLLELP